MALPENITINWRGSRATVANFIKKLGVEYGLDPKDSFEDEFKLDSVNELGHPEGFSRLTFPSSFQLGLAELITIDKIKQAWQDPELEDETDLFIVMQLTILVGKIMDMIDAYELTIESGVQGEKSRRYEIQRARELLDLVLSQAVNRFVTLELQSELEYHYKVGKISTEK